MDGEEIDPGQESKSDGSGPPLGLLRSRGPFSRAVKATEKS
jgi:hypothetical protein